jgi:hypothetical protein
MEATNHSAENTDSYKRVYLFDAFDEFISSTYGIDMECYIRLVDHEMSDEDTEKVIFCALDGAIEEGQLVIRKYLKQ